MNWRRRRRLDSDAVEDPCEARSDPYMHKRGNGSQHQDFFKWLKATMSESVGADEVTASKGDSVT